MRVERAVLRQIPLRLKEYFEISSGGMQDRRILLLTLYSEGLEGWSECVVGEDPAYSYEFTNTAWHVLTEFILPGIVGRDAEGPEDILAPVRWVRGHNMAKASVEMAGWDLAAHPANGVQHLFRALDVPSDDAGQDVVGEHVPSGLRRLVGIRRILTRNALTPALDSIRVKGQQQHIAILHSPAADLKVLLQAQRDLAQGSTLDPH